MNPANASWVVLALVGNNINGTFTTQAYAICSP
jgi:hypothetical protein